MSAAKTRVRVGQVWVDNDKRSRGRPLMVLEVDDTHASVVWADTGRHTRIRLTRFRPNSTGYRLMSDVPPYDVPLITDKRAGRVGYDEDERLIVRERPPSFAANDPDTEHEK